MNLIIRQYQSSDLNACRELWQELTEYHRKIYNDPSIGGEHPELYFDEHLKKVGTEKIWVAEYESKVVGFTGLIVEGEEAEVEPLIVLHEYRNKGIGKALTDYCIEQAKKLNIRYLSVKPVARNESAIKYFYNAGFWSLGHIEMFMELPKQNPNKWKSGLKFQGRKFDY